MYDILKLEEGRKGETERQTAWRRRRESEVESESTAMYYGLIK